MQKRDKYRVINVSELRAFVREDAWDEFVALIDDLKPDRASPAGGVFEDILDCVGLAFERDVSNIVGPTLNREDNDAASCAAYLLSRAGFKNSKVADLMDVQEPTIIYRKRKFENLYETDPMFQRKTNIALHELYLRDYVAIKVN